MKQSKREYRAQKEEYRRRIAHNLSTAEVSIDSSLSVKGRHEKALAMIAYGGACVNCGTMLLDTLELDHVNNNGKQHRILASKGRAGKEFYRALRKQGYPNREPYKLEIRCNQCHKIQTVLRGRKKNAETEEGRRDSQ